jgi:hypothetical protein
MSDPIPFPVILVEISLDQVLSSQSFYALPCDSSLADYGSHIPAVKKFAIGSRVLLQFVDSALGV